jgi:hypothetical protein
VRIPFPERIPIEGTAIFAIGLFVVQQMEHTALYFSVGCLVFLLIATFAFNTAGGLTRISGGYVFFYSLLVVVVGLCYKAYLGEPAETNLLDPRRTIEVYVGGITAMLGAVVLTRRFCPRTGLLQDLMKDSDMYRISIGCMVFGAGGPFAIALLGNFGTQLSTAFAQLNQLIPLGIIIGVMYEIRTSHGKRSVNLPILLGGAYFFVVYGVAGFSKQGLFTPLVCWLVPVCALRFRMSLVQVAGVLFAGVVIFKFLAPFADYGRRYRLEGQTLSQRIEVAIPLLENPSKTAQDYKEDNDTGQAGYYNKPQGFWDRLQFISVDDGLINITDQGKVFGWLPISASFLNAIPHFLWPDKPGVFFGNVYMHEVTGIAADEATDIGISYSPTAEAFHMGRWAGIFIAAPLIWFMLFMVFDSLLGDVRASPWGLLVLALISHVAPEGAISGAIGFMTFGAETIIFCALFATWVAPIFATPVLGPDRRKTGRRLLLQPALGRPAEK